MSYDIYYDDINNAVNEFVTTYQKEIPKSTKNQDAFEKREGVCYIDPNGKEYTYKDLLKITGSDNGAENLFNDLKNETVEQCLEDNWHFRKCPRCDSWIYNKNFSLFKNKSEWICQNCRPVKTNGIITVDKDPYADDRKFYTKKKVVFKSGVTTLIGCNGIGKTTLLHNIKEQLKAKGVPVFLFDNLSDEGGGHAGTNMLSRVLSGLGDDESGESVELAASLWASSEGECIQNSLIRFANKLIRSFKMYDGFGEYWILFDAIDSGLSLDMIEYVKKYLFDVLMKKLPSESDVYIISSSNSYELAEETQMFLIAKMAYADIKSYNTYKKKIHESLDYKEKRDHILDVKFEIRHTECEWKINENNVKMINEGKCVNDDEIITLFVNDYKMVCSVNSDDSSSETKFSIYKKENDEFVKQRNPKMYFNSYWNFNLKEIQEEMHDNLCEFIFQDYKKQKMI